MGQKMYGGHSTSPASVVKYVCRNTETKKILYLPGQHWIIGRPALNHWQASIESLVTLFFSQNKADSKKIISWIYPPKHWIIFRRPGLANPKPSFCHCLAGRSKSFHPTNQPTGPVASCDLLAMRPNSNVSCYLEERKTTAQWRQLPTALTGYLLGYIGDYISKKLSSYIRGFLKWWYPTTICFPTKNDQHLGCFGDTTILGNPHIEMTTTQL